MTTTVQQLQQITGELSPKRVGAYLHASHKTNSIRAQRREDGSFFLADGFLAVWVPQHPDLLPFTFFPAEWQRATFAAKEESASEGGPDIASLWERWMDAEAELLTVTPYLWESDGERHKTGQLNRKFVAYDLQREKYVVYLNKKLCDVLDPSFDELEGFQFETEGHYKPVRIAARNGYVAVMMPMTKKR